MLISRRRLLTAGAAMVAASSGVIGGVEVGALPGRTRVSHLLGTLGLGGCDIDARPPGGRTGPVSTQTFHSLARGRTVDLAVHIPAGVPARGLPVALVLHGLGGGAHTGFDVLGLHHFLAAHIRSGGAPIALAGVDGGGTYWHRRASGDDPLAMITTEVLPRLTRLGLDTRRLGAMGWSMGGYGVLLLARESGGRTLGGVHLRAVAAGSPALFASAGASAPGAFDSPADWARWGDLARAPAVAAGVQVQADCGDADPFTSLTRRYLTRAGRSAHGTISRGCHTEGYWRSRARSQLAFLASHLA